MNHLHVFLCKLELLRGGGINYPDNLGHCQVGGNAEVTALNVTKIISHLEFPTFEQI